MRDRSVNSDRLLARIRELGAIGRDDAGRLVRLAASDADKDGRDQFVAWLRETDLEVAVDRVGNIFGIWRPENASEAAPLMIGSHIDTVIDAGIYDGCYGVLSGLEVIATLREERFSPSRPIVVAAFTNEEGVRFAPDMMGSLVYAGGLDVEAALSTVGTDGTVLGDELRRIGYAGASDPGFMRPHAYIELHIEQGPVLEREQIQIGIVENVQGISWQRVTIDGDANHAGTTPISMRKDAGYAAARVVTFLRERAKASNAATVATVGCMSFEPNAINVVPSRATFTVDLRDPDEERLLEEEVALERFLDAVAIGEDVSIHVERLARFQPVKFDRQIVNAIEKAAEKRGYSHRLMTSGAGHDAQMIASLASAAMIFVPSIEGMSHNPKEKTNDRDLISGANLLLDVVCELAN